MGEGEAGSGKRVGAGDNQAGESWAALREYLIQVRVFRSGDFIEQGPSGNVSIDTSKLPERETDEELKARMREAFRREMDKLHGDD